MVPKTKNSDAAPSLKEMIVQQIDDLPETSLREVLDLVEYLKKKQTPPNWDVEDPILSVLGTISMEPLSSRQIDEELYGPMLIEDRADSDAAQS